MKHPQTLSKISKAAWAAAKSSGLTGQEKKDFAYSEIRRLWAELKDLVSAESVEIDKRIAALIAEKDMVVSGVHQKFCAKLGAPVAEVAAPVAEVAAPVAEVAAPVAEVAAPVAVAQQKDYYIIIDDVYKNAGFGYLLSDLSRDLKNEGEDKKFKNVASLKEFFCKLIGICEEDIIRFREKPIGISFYISSSKLEELQKPMAAAEVIAHLQKTTGFNKNSHSFCRSGSLFNLMGMTISPKSPILNNNKKTAGVDLNADKIETTGVYNFKYIDECRLKFQKVKNEIYEDGRIKMKWNEEKKHFVISLDKSSLKAQILGEWIGDLLNIEGISDKREEILGE